MIGLGWNWPNRTSGVLGVGLLVALLIVRKDPQARQRIAWAFAGLFAGTLVLIMAERIPGDDTVFLSEGSQQQLNQWVGLVGATLVLAWAGGAAAAELGRAAVVQARRVIAWLGQRVTGSAPHFRARRQQAKAAFVTFLVFLLSFVALELRAISPELIQEMAPTTPFWARAAGAGVMVLAIMASMIRGAVEGKDMSLELVRDTEAPLADVAPQPLANQVD